jgi:hypothetical protein
MARLGTALQFALVTLLVAWTGAAHAAVVPNGGMLDFAVVRDGEEIGSYVLSFHEAKDRLDVTVKTRIKVKMAFITVYRFEHDSHEVWKGGKLVQMNTSTNDDGTDHKLMVTADGSGKLRVIGDGKQMTADPDTIPASLWNPAFIQNNDLMDSLVGKPLAIKVADMGEDTVTAWGKPVKAHHYSMTGDLARELWYDQNGTLVHMTLIAQDGSGVEYVLQ